jgi:fatty-acyl-CoA synthase
MPVNTQSFRHVAIVVPSSQVTCSFSSSSPRYHMQAPFSRTAFELLCEQAAKAPDRPIAITAAGSVSYAALASRTRAIAQRLRGSGIGRGDPVGLLANNCIEWLEIFFAASALGAVVVPFSTWSTSAELDFMLRDSGVRHLFTLSRLGERDFAHDIAALRTRAAHPRLEKVILIDALPRTGAEDGFEAFADYREGEAVDALPPGQGASAADTLVVLYTSGSSSRPKAVPLQHFAAIENGFNIGERQGLLPGDRVLVAVPLFWSYGAVNALPATLTHGATLVLQGRFEPGEALDLIERHACTAIYTLPAMTNALLAHPAFAPRRTASLRTGVTIGAPQDVIKAARQLGAAEICNIYGSTETYGNCCVTPHHWPLEQRASCQGPPLPGVHARIRDPETGRACKPGEVGQIEVKGYLTQGYAGASSRHTAETFTPDGYFTTGDLGALRPDGVIVFMGRHSEMIKRSGINVSPAEVEEVLQQHSCVGLVGVTGVDDAFRGEIIVAYVIARPGAALTPEALLDHCRTRLSSYKVPDRLYLCEALPQTATGKLQRRELRTMATTAALAEAGAAGATTLSSDEDDIR